MKRKLRDAILATTAMTCIAAVNAAAPDGRAVAAGCASCHQPTERTPPPLGGRSRDDLLGKLRAFHDGTRSGTVMPQLARGYTEAQIEAVAAWFAAQPPR